MTPEIKKLALRISKIGLSGSLLLSACQENGVIIGSTTPSSLAPTPIEVRSTPAKDKLSQEEKEAIVEQVLKTNNYSQIKISQIEDLIKAGTPEDQLFELENKGKVLVSFSKLALSSGTDLSASDIGLWLKQKDEERLTYLKFDSSINQGIVSHFPPSVADNLVKREATVIYLQILSLTEIFRLRGIDLSQSLDPQLQKVGMSEFDKNSLVDDLV